MKAKLIVLQGARTKELRLQLPTVIGRGSESTIKLPASTVSRSHTEIYEFEGQLVVRDLGSANGTLVNGTRIEGPTYVTIEDEISIGPLTFRLQAIEEPPRDDSHTDSPNATPLPAEVATAEMRSEGTSDATEATEDLPVVSPSAGGPEDVGPTDEANEAEQLDEVDAAFRKDHSAAASLPVHDVPVFEAIPADVGTPSADESDEESSFDSSLIESPAYMPEQPSAEDSILRYEESDDGEHSFLGILAAGDGVDDESLPIDDLQIPGPVKEAVSEVPNFDGIDEMEKKVVDDGDLNDFFKHLDSE